MKANLRQSFHISVAATSILTFVVGCRPQEQSAPPSTNAVARVGTAAITAEAFRAEWARRAPGRSTSTNERQAVLAELVQLEALHQKALAAGYDQDPQIAASLKRMIVAKYREDQLAKLTPPNPNTADITNYYTQHPGRFGTPEKLRAAIIEIKVARTASPEKRAEARQRAATLRQVAVTASAAEETFGVLAQNHSEDQATRYRGGDMGWLAAGAASPAWPPEAMHALAQLKEPREISPVVESPTAFYLVKLVARQPATLRPFAEVRDGIAYLLTREREREQQEEFCAAALQGMSLWTNRALLDSVVLPEETTAPPTFPGGVAAAPARKSP
jgi:hypothetical protein